MSVTHLSEAVYERFCAAQYAASVASGRGDWESAALLHGDAAAWKERYEQMTSMNREEAA